MIRFPHAKLNIGLHILGRRSDGYHELQSVLYPIGLCELLELIPGQASTGPELSISGDRAQETSENDLVLQAYRGLPDPPYTPPRIHLHKRIPQGAGLGGGSSDAAQLLRAYAPSFDPFDPSDPISKTAAKIGSDVPFFLQDKPVLVSGRGERMAPLDLDLGGFYLLLLVPPFSISTGTVYQKLEATKGKELDIPHLMGNPLTEWEGRIRNDLEGPAFELRPELHELKDELYEAGAAYASMSGSGSGVFGLFREEPPSIPGKADHLRWTEELPSIT